MDPALVFGMLLRRHRKAHDLSQEALAQRAFCALDTIKKLESGRRRPSRQLAAQLAEVLGLSGAERDAFLTAARAGISADTAAPDEQAPLTAVVPTTIQRPLPQQVTPFIGRTNELAHLLHLIAQPDTRLITLVAPGGMGKTRLALSAAERIRDAELFPNGVAFAALAPVIEPTGIDPALADGLGLPLIPPVRAAHAANYSTICGRKNCCWCWIIASICASRWLNWLIPS